MFNSSSSSFKERLEIIQSEQVEKFNLDMAEKSEACVRNQKCSLTPFFFFC
jgi:hypothetical protein